MIRPRFYSAKYDSTIQSDLRKKIIASLPDAINFQYRSILKQLYKVNLKLDLLLGGNIVFTDSQFFDGYYFHCLAEDQNDLDDFFNFVNTINGDGAIPRQIEIKCRPEIDGKDLLYRILEQKSFIFSSQSGNNKVFREAINNGVERNQGNRTIDDLLSLAKQYIHANYNDKLNDFNRYSKALLKLKHKTRDSGINVCDNWVEVTREGYNAYTYFMRKYLADYIANMNSQTGHHDIDHKLYPELINKLNVERIARSDITALFTEFRNNEYNGFAPELKRHVDMLEHNFNMIYNRALASQHGCNLIHVYSSSGAIHYFEGHDMKMFDFVLTSNLFSNMASESWMEFAKTILSDEIEPHYTRWWNLLINDSNKDKGETRRCLEKYAKAINKHYDQNNRWNISLRHLIEFGNVLGMLNYSNFNEKAPEQTVILAGFLVFSEVINGLRFGIRYLLDYNLNIRSLVEYTNYITKNEF